MAQGKCLEHTTNKTTRAAKCKRTGKDEGCNGKMSLCPLKGLQNINWGKVQ